MMRLAVAVLFLVFLLVPAVSHLTYFGLDITRVDLPFLCDLRNHLASGHSLLLSKYIGNGEPFLANPQTQVLYPIRWIQALLPATWGIPFGVAFHLAVAGAGMAYLAISYGIAPAAAAAAVFLFALSGTVLDLIVHTVYLLDAAWLPWIWAASRRLVRGEGGSAAGVGLVVSVTALLLGGEPFGLLLVAPVLLGEAIVELRRDPDRRKATGLRIALTAGLLACGALIGMVEWIPAWNELRLGSHAGGLSPAANLAWSFELPHALAVLLPNALNEPVADAGTIWNAYLHWAGIGENAPELARTTWNGTPFLGAVFLALAALAVRRREFRLTAIALLFSFLLALGPHTPLLPVLLRVLPPLRALRYPLKYLIVGQIAISLLAAAAIDVVGRDERARKSAFRLLCGMTAALAIGALVAFVRAAPPSAEGLPSAGRLLARLCGQEALIAAAALLAVRFLGRPARAIAALAILDLALAAGATVPLGPELLTVHSPLAAFRATPTEPASAVLCFHADLESLEFGQRAPGDNGVWNRFLALRTLDVPNVNACDQIVSGTPYSILEGSIRTELRDRVSENHASAARALGCTHLVSTQPPRDEPAEAIDVPGLVGAAGGPRVFRLSNPIPQAFVSTTGGSGATAGVSSLNWPEPTRATVEVRGTGPAIVGIRSTYAAGWRARQGDHELETVRAAGTMIGAVVDDLSRGPVEFTYRAIGLPAGVAAALVGLMATLLLLRVYSRHD